MPDQAQAHEEGLHLLTLTPSDLARLASHLEPALDTLAPEELALTPRGPGRPVLIDHQHLWNLIRHDAPPWTDPTARARFTLAILTTLGGAERLKTCAHPGCTHSLVDKSNNQTRRRCPQHRRPKHNRPSTNSASDRHQGAQTPPEQVLRNVTTPDL